MDAAKSRGIMCHVAIDQFNTPREKETKCCVTKPLNTVYKDEFAYAIHVNLYRRHPKEYRYQLYQKMRQAQLMMIACLPVALIRYNLAKG